MAANKLIFKDAEAARDAILDSQKKYIANLYNKWGDEIYDEAIKRVMSDVPSGELSGVQLGQLEQMLKQTANEVNKAVADKVKQSIYEVADATVQSSKEWLTSLGFDEESIGIAFSNVPDKMVQKLVTGQIYDSGWSLSQRIWGDSQDTQRKLYEIVAGGVAQNKPIYDIAKDLQQYVKPSVAKHWNLKDKDGRRIYPKAVDYNAQRLARTLVQHGYQQGFKEVNDNNPFITEYIWDANGSRVCPICLERDGKHFTKGPVTGSITDTSTSKGKATEPLPMDHPNGMCVMIPVEVDNLEDSIINWANSPNGTYPEIDKFAQNFGWNPNIPKDLTVEDVLNKWGQSDKTLNHWLKQMSPQEKAEVTALKKKSGLTWDEWYAKNIFKGDYAAKQAIAAAKKASKQLQKNVIDSNVVFNRDEWKARLRNNDIAGAVQADGTWKRVPPKYEKFGEDWVNTLTDNEKHGINVYTGGSYREINKYRRGITNSISSDLKTTISEARNALDKASLPEDIIVRRGSDFKSLVGMLGIDTNDQKAIDIFVKNYKNYVGAPAHDKGFLSTSPSSQGGFSDEIEYTILLPKGAKAAYVADISQFRSEKEMLVNVDSRYVVEDFIVDRDRIKEVFLRYILK